MAARAHKRKEGVRACNFDLFGNTQNLPRVTKLVVAEAFLRMRYACSTITHLLSKAVWMAGRSRREILLFLQWLWRVTRSSPLPPLMRSWWQPTVYTKLYVVTVFEGVGGPRLKIYSHPAGVRCNIWLLISASIEHHTGIPRPIEKLKRYVLHVFKFRICLTRSTMKSPSHTIVANWGNCSTSSKRKGKQYAVTSFTTGTKYYITRKILCCILFEGKQAIIRIPRSIAWFQVGFHLQRLSFIFLA